MAYERFTKQKVVGSSLDSFIKNLSSGLMAQVAARNAEDEMAFNKAVLEGNISLEAQLEFRQEQAKREIDSPEERKRIKDEIAGLKNRIEQKTYSDQYTDKLLALSSGATSVDSIVDWLKTSKANTTNQTIISSIDKQLVEAEKQKFQLNKDMIDNQTDYALNDKSEKVLNSQIKKVETAKSRALLAGDKELASNYDLQLQALSKAKTETKIDNVNRELLVSTAVGNHTAVNLLDAYNDKIDESSNKGSITVNGNTFKSERDYWTFTRDSYVADDGATGLFARLNKEVNNDLITKSSQNKLDQTELTKATKVYNQIATRPELSGYESKVDLYRQDSLQSGANLVADKITNDYANNYDVNAALGAFKGLTDLGVNVSSEVTKVLTTNANLKEGPTRDIITAAYDMMAANPGLSVSDAVISAIQKGAGSGTLSPKDLAGKTSADIAKDQIGITENETGAEDPRLNPVLATVPPKTPNVNTPAPAAPTAPTVTAPSVATKNNSGSTNNGSIVDYLNSQKQASDFASRAKLAEQNGITNYTGTAEQNTKLLGIVSAPKAPAASTTNSGGGGSNNNNTSTTTKTNTNTNNNNSSSNNNSTPSASKPKPTTGYQGPSIVDYLSSTGKNSSYSNRTKLAEQNGITNYTGSASQNTKLLKKLRGY